MSQGSFQQQSRTLPPAHSPYSDSFLHPAKRQKTDSAPSSPFAPTPQSPFASSPSFTNISLPNGYNPQRQHNGMPAHSLPAVSQRLGPGVMGPPQRPADRTADKQEEKPERHLDVNELSDLVTASGIDLREEENYLAASYRTDRNNTSFTSQAPSSAQTSFDLLSQSSFDAIGSQRAATSLQPETKSTTEQELYDKHKKAARAVNESQQHHLAHPFLWGNAIRRRMERITNDNGVRVPLEGLFDRVPDRPQSMSGVSMSGADGEGLLVATAPSVLNRGTPLEPMLCLISLAANERIRGLLEDAYGLARGRQFSSDGIVPPEWSDLALGDSAQSTTAIPQSISRSPWDTVPDAEVNGAVKDEQQALPSPPNSNPDYNLKSTAAVPTLAFSKTNPITHALTTLARADRAAEETRRKLRAARASKKAAQAAAAASATPGDSAFNDGTATLAADGGKKLPPGMIGERAPEVKMTKKEREKLAKQDMSDEVATRNANSTASLQLGGLGKKYSWLGGGGGGGKSSLGPAARQGKGAGIAGGGATGTAGTGAGGGAGSKPHPEGWPAQDRRFGEWREDGVGGKGIQLRDWIGVLELDGRERATLGWALMKNGAPPAVPASSQVSSADGVAHTLNALPARQS